jgi:sugar/nucleoside kinase (ribokinase family)
MPSSAMPTEIKQTPFRAASLCVVGNLNRDLRTSPFPPGDYLFRDGETSVASVVETIGGGGANSAAAAAALGANVAFLGKVGKDPLGERLENALARCGVCTHLRRDSAHPTGTSINLVFDDGQRHFVSSLPNNESLAFEDLELGPLPGYAHLFRADVWFSQAMLYGGNERLFRAAKDCGMKISIDLNWDPCWTVAAAEEVRRRKEAIRRVLPLVDLAHGNIRELNQFAECGELETTLRRLTDWGAGAVVVHMGEQGAGYYERGSLITEPPVPATRFVNATGTGDALSVCMMLLASEPSMPVRDKLRLSNAIVCEFIEGRREFHPVL